MASAEPLSPSSRTALLLRVASTALRVGRHGRDALRGVRAVLGGATMSYQAIAAALARDDLSAGERLVAFASASFADGDHLARPGTSAAAGRAGLSKSRFLEARDGLVCRGLLVVEGPATGRGRACTLGLPFAGEGPWWDGEINAELFETVLGYSRAQGSARLLVAAMAALANERGVVAGFTTAELCAAAGITERTYGRVRGPLLR